MTAETVVPAARAGDDASAHAVFVAWERLRLAYKGLVVVLALALSGRALGHPSYWGHLVLMGIAANINFCAGPVAEGYLTVLGVPRRHGRWIVFALGCALAVALTALVVTGRLPAPPGPMGD